MVVGFYAPVSPGGLSMGDFMTSTRPFAGDPAITVLALEGTCNHETADRFEDAILELFSQKKYKIILDMEKLTYISSRGLGTLMSSINQARNLKGDIVIIRVTPGVASIFDLLDIPQLFRIYRNEENASMVLSAKPPKDQPGPK
jgi:anti-sigma B factor antagonist